MHDIVLCIILCPHTQCYEQTYFIIASLTFEASYVLALLLACEDGGAELEESSSWVHSSKQLSPYVSQMLCKTIQDATRSETLLKSQSIRFNKHLHCPFKRPNAFSTTIRALL